LLRVIGEPKAPIKIIFFTTVQNILLDLLFVGALDLRAAGAALATILSQITSLCLIAYVCTHRFELYRFSRKSIRIDITILKPILKVGAPQILQFTSTNASFLVLGSLVNVYGVAASAAAGAVTKIWNFSVLPGQAMMSALVSVSAQNLPDKKYDRILKSFFCGASIVAGIALVVTLFCELTPAAMLSLFTSDAEVINAGIGYLRLYAVGFIVENVMFCMYAPLMGAGLTLVQMSCALVNSCIVRLFVAWLLSSFTSLGFQGLALAFSAAPYVSVIITAPFLITGKWKVNHVRV
ncbi:MAG: hypothetical protein LUE31_04010, partial [Lachnospiraceae bacterium]|nr:hypothetical protein [Lachnospiraceae bacterium]